MYFRLGFVEEFAWHISIVSAVSLHRYAFVLSRIKKRQTQSP